MTRYDEGSTDSDTVEEERDIHILTKNHGAPAEGIFCDERGNAKKPFTLEDYHHVCHVDMGERMANSYSISHRT